MLHLIQKEIAEKTGIPCGKLILIVKSAHFYLRDREKVLAIIENERGVCRRADCRAIHCTAAAMRKPGNVPGV